MRHQTNPHSGARRGTPAGHKASDIRRGASVGRGKFSAGPAVRIASGRFRGQTLATPGAGTHPMGSREKLALFNIVNVESRRVLDAYAGSGALGLEALSRGAASVVFAESSSTAARVIRENLARLGLTGAAEVCRASVEQFARDYLSREASTASKSRGEEVGFDVIFADPPYDHVYVAELALLVSLLAPGGVLALSSPASAPAPALPDLRVSSTHTYARARITLYRVGN